MAEIPKSKIPVAQLIFNDIWDYYKRFYVPEKNDNYWNDLAEEGMKIREKHNNNPLALSQMIVMFIAQFMEIIKTKILENQYSSHKKKQNRHLTKGTNNMKKKNYVFDVVVTCQGQPFHKYCNTLVGALARYSKHRIEQKQIKLHHTEGK